MKALLVTLLLAQAKAQPPGEDDVVMRALADEVQRAMTLAMPGADKPYFARAYAVTSEALGVSASFGALLAPTAGKELSLSAGLRVGSAKFDQTNFSGSASAPVRPSPSEEDVDAIRRALWLAFDGLYKNSVEALARKRAFLQSNQVKELIDDWGQAPAERVVLPLVPAPKVDEEAWAAQVRRASAECRASPQVHQCVVALRMRHQCQRLVASVGVRSRFCDTRVETHISLTGQAADGMPVGAEWKHLGTALEHLPSADALAEQVRAQVKLLEAKLAAPTPTEDYVGPVLFTGAAAPAFFLVTLAAPLSSPREPLGASEQGRLIDRLGKHIAVSQLTAVADATQATWTSPTGEVLPLLGHYPVDDDGVVPQRLTLVQEGVLKTFFMSRVPTKAVRATNGHARGEQASVGSLFVSTSKPTPLAELKKRLIELAKEEDADCGLMVSLLPRADARPSAQSVQLPNLPTLVHRVCADGREELVRGYAFKPTSSRVLKDIVAMGDDPTLLNTEQLGQDVSAVAPSVLVRLLELTRSRDDFGKPPVLKRPALSVTR
jgi:hypothetical protein